MAAEEVARYLGPVGGLMSLVEVDMRVYAHDAILPDHCMDFRCLMPFQVALLRDMVLHVWRVDAWYTIRNIDTLRDGGVQRQAGLDDDSEPARRPGPPVLCSRLGSAGEGDDCQRPRSQGARRGGIAEAAGGCRGRRLAGARGGLQDL